MKWALVSALLLVATPAFADVGTTETRLLARDLATQGADAYDRGSFEEALDLFKRAGAMLNAPTITLMEGRCLVHLGRWTEALDRFHVTGHMELPSDAPPPFFVAVQEATREALDMERKIPHLKLIADASLFERDQVQVSIDGNPVQAILLNVPQPINPGEHHLKASAENKEYFATSVTMYPEQAIDIALPPPPSKTPAPLVVAKVEPAPAPVVEESSAAPSWLLPVGIGVTAVGVVGGVVTGILAAKNKAHLDRACPLRNGKAVCEPSDADNKKAYDVERGVFIGSAVLALAGVGVTTYALVHSPSQVQVSLGFGALEISGVF